MWVAALFTSQGAPSRFGTPIAGVDESSTGVGVVTPSRRGGQGSGPSVAGLDRVGGVGTAPASPWVTAKLAGAIRRPPARGSRTDRGEAPEGATATGPAAL